MLATALHTSSIFNDDIFIQCFFHIWNVLYLMYGKHNESLLFFNVGL